MILKLHDKQKKFVYWNYIDLNLKIILKHCKILKYIISKWHYFDMSVFFGICIETLGKAIHFRGVVLLFEFHNYFVRASHSLFSNFAITPFETLSRAMFPNVPNLHCWRERRSSVLRVCPTEIPDMSGEMRRRPIRETRLIGIPRRVEPTYPCFRARNISTSRRGATRPPPSSFFSHFAILERGIPGVIPATRFCSLDPPRPRENYPDTEIIRWRSLPGIISFIPNVWVNWIHSILNIL